MPSNEQVQFVDQIVYFYHSESAVTEANTAQRPRLIVSDTIP